jgi:hypothetical protein
MTLFLEVLFEPGNQDRQEVGEALGFDMHQPENHGFASDSNPLANELMLEKLNKVIFFHKIIFKSLSDVRFKR